MNITKDQAIKELSESIDMMRSYKVDEDESRLMRALRMAISALEQPCETSTDEPMTMVYPTLFCDDAISREAVKKAINCWLGSGEYKYAMSERFLYDRINELPSVQPSRKGHWIDNENNFWKCSECGREIYSTTTEDLQKHHFCWWCGADMRGDKDADSN